jgi:hypothetical protein
LNVECQLPGGLLQNGFIAAGNIEGGRPIEGDDQEIGHILEIEAWAQHLLLIGFRQPALKKLGKAHKAPQDVAAHGGGLAGQLHQHIDEKASTVKCISGQIFMQDIVASALDALQRILDVSHVFENDFSPDAYSFFINGIPDVFLALEVAVQPALGQFGCLEDIADSGVKIAFDGKELQCGLNDFFTGSGTFIRHGKIRSISAKVKRQKKYRPVLIIKSNLFCQASKTMNLIFALRDAVKRMTKLITANFKPVTSYSDRLQTDDRLSS